MNDVVGAGSYELHLEELNKHLGESEKVQSAYYELSINSDR